MLMLLLRIRPCTPIAKFRLILHKLCLFKFLTLGKIPKFTVIHEFTFCVNNPVLKSFYEKNYCTGYKIVISLDYFFICFQNYNFITWFVSKLLQWYNRIQSCGSPFKHMHLVLLVFIEWTSIEPVKGCRVQISHAHTLI